MKGVDAIKAFQNKGLKILFAFVVMVCLLCMGNTANALDAYWTLMIEATGQFREIMENPVNVDRVYIGIFSDEETFDHPPKVPAYTVYMYLSDDLWEDYREEGSLREIWDLTMLIENKADASLPGFFPELSWNPNDIGPASKIELRSGDEFGGLLVADMRATSSYQTKEADADFYLPQLNEAMISYSIVFEPIIWYRDQDGDGCGDPNDWKTGFEEEPPGYVTEDCDCDDGDEDRFEGNTEICDGKDNDCDSIVPADEVTDADEDGYVACEDCDDTDEDRFPGNTEICDGKDNDCDEMLPNDEKDLDEDGYSVCDGDCDDEDEERFPDNPEICDGKDNNCNDEIDEEVLHTFFRDVDEDGYGDPNDTVKGCEAPSGYVPDNTDCNDGDDAINPNASELPDGKDNDCDGLIDEGYFIDTDLDEMNDWWEQKIIDSDTEDDIDTIEQVFPGDDFDDDGLTNFGEYWNDTEPLNPDTDADSIPDGWEVDHDLDPLFMDDSDDDPDGDGFTNLEEYKGGTDPQDNFDRPTRPYVDRNECHPFPGQGIRSTILRVSIDTSIVIRLKDDSGIDTNSIHVELDGNAVHPLFKQVNKNNKDYWVIYHPMQEFEVSQKVDISIDAANIFGITMTQPYSYSFQVESQIEHEEAQDNFPDSIRDESDPSQHVLTAASGSQIKGAKIIYDPSELITPRFGPTGELPPLTGLNAIGVPVALEPPAVFNNPVTIFIPCPGVIDLSRLVIYYYNPSVGWIRADQADGFMVADSLRNHPETVPPTIEIRVYHFSGVQAGLPSTGNVIPIGGGGSGGVGCFIDNTTF